MELRILDLELDKLDPVFEATECQQLFDIYQDYYKSKGFVIPWVAYFIMSHGAVVGTCSFTEKPKNGIVEIAYWTFKEFEGKGVASFACKALLEIAQKTDPKVVISAKTAPEHNASSKILQKNGFTFKQLVQDDEIGDAWLWIKN